MVATKRTYGDHRRALGLILSLMQSLPAGVVGVISIRMIRPRLAMPAIGEDEVVDTRCLLCYESQMRMVLTWRARYRAAAEAPAVLQSLFKTGASAHGYQTQK
jgi:hypothetical protein